MPAKQITKFKSGVEIYRPPFGGKPAVQITPMIVLAISIAGRVFNTQGYDLIITSVCDGKHGKNSYHYLGNAFDCRRRHLVAGSVNPIFLALKEALPKEMGFDVVLEKTHFHIEFDVRRLQPKKGGK